VYSGLVQQSLQQAVLGKQLVAAEGSARTSYEVFVVSISLCAAFWAGTGVMALFTDWQVAPIFSVAPGKALSFDILISF
jgi:hypothetical protein